MKVDVDITQATLQVKRQELSNIIYACLLLLERRDVNKQVVGNLNIVCSDQTVTETSDPANYECKAFIDVILSVRDRMLP